MSADHPPGPHPRPSGARRATDGPPARAGRAGHAAHVRAARAAGALGRHAGRPPLAPTFVLLLALVVVLNLIGLVMVLSASSVTSLYEYGSSWYQFKRQLLWVALGLVALVVVDADRLPPRGGACTHAAAASASGLLMVAGARPRPRASTSTARRAGSATASLRIQPSEFAKLAVLLFVADLLARRADKVDDWRLTLQPVLVVFGVVRRAAHAAAQPRHHDHPRRRSCS